MTTHSGGCTIRTGRVPLACAAVLVCIFGGAAGASAELARPIGPLFFGGTAASRDVCEHLAVTRPARRPRTSDPSTAEIGICLQLLRAVLSSPPPDALAQMQHDVPGLSMRGARHRLLLHTYRALQQLTPWVTFMAEHADASALVTAIASLDADAGVALHDQSLLGAKYAAVLRGGVVEADSGGSGEQPAGAPGLGVRSASVLLDFDSAHADLGWGWDASMTFEFGRQPVFSMVKPPSASAAMPGYRDGWVTSQAFSFNRTSRSVETAIVGRVGATRLDAAGLAANGVAEWALFFDARAELRWYNRDVWLTRLSAQTLNPLVRSYAGIRHDQRFHRAGDLSSFDDPTGRLFFGFVVTPIRVGDPHAEGSGNTLLTAGGGFEFEGAVRGPTRLPSGFKVLATVNVDLRRALRR